MNTNQEKKNEPWCWWKKVQLVPSATWFKLRKDIFAIRLGANVKMDHTELVHTISNATSFSDAYSKLPTPQIKDFSSKVVLKPLSPKYLLWKVLYEHSAKELSFVMKKPIPIFQLLNIQLGAVYNFEQNEMHFKWKFTSINQTGGDGVSRLRKKKSFSFYPGIEFRMCGTADYALPQLTLKAFFGGQFKGPMEMLKDRILQADLLASIEKAEVIFMYDAFTKSRKH